MARVTTKKVLKPGDRVEMTSPSNGGILKGTRGIVTSSTTVNTIVNWDNGCIGYGHPTIFLAKILLKKSDIKEEIAALEEEISDAKAKLEIMEEYGLDEYDPNLLKVSKVLKALDNKKLDSKERTLLISKLISA